MSFFEFRSHEKLQSKHKTRHNRLKKIVKIAEIMTAAYMKGEAYKRKSKTKFIQSKLQMFN